MSKFAKRARVVAVVAVVPIGALLVPAISQAQAPGPTRPVSDVNVVNTPTVTVGNTPTVTVGNTPTVTVGNASDSPALVRNVDAAAATHVGRRASDLVTLIALQNVNDDYHFLRQLPDGRAEELAIPAGHMLVVTDVEWTGQGSPNQFETVTVLARNIENPALARGLYRSTVTLDGTGRGGASDHMTTGFVVSPAAELDVTVAPAGVALLTLILRGYFVPA